MPAAFIGIDWGSTNFRAYLVDDDQSIMDKKSSDCGMLSLESHQFSQVLHQQIGAWLSAHPALPIFMAGMVGARSGWVEADYLPCPVQLDQLVDALTPVDLDTAHPAYIIPGLSMTKSGESDVMRGEETQILGALDASNRHEVMCLPGTHSKWVLVKKDRVDAFQTFMTGELFSLLETKSILAKQMQNQINDEAAFLDGVKRAKCYRGLLSELFKVRSAMLLGQLQEAHSRSYLSGLLIGYEIMNARAYWESVEEIPIKVIAEPELSTWYLKVFESFGCCKAVAIAPEHASVNGLAMIAKLRSEK